ncbi:hypothetical protein C6A87_013600 [Mycobacterium sp. ITM-2016-00317]|uniref:hypothetical protein n=1 Tax=Mycobacterium sp. ITM-2016-00317 TaxID=2099694 RepID=UPI000D4D2C23|nr:hypothetical protein [Mycobacterium sp. ITM-2016-00317]WNG90067.1 hypothetical protein C6A87_013600 [Mycobacterium sp. ITM-2016-00317]
MTQDKMTRSSLHRAFTGAFVGTALAFGLVMGVAPVASAQPTTKAEEPPAPRISPDQVLMMISQEYQTGRGGGQVSKLIEQVMTLRSRGIRPSIANTQALAAGLDARPNQGPLIEALKSTLTYQRKALAQSQGAQQQAPAAPGPQTGMGPSGPSWAPGQGNPMLQDGDTIFPMPGR